MATSYEQLSPEDQLTLVTALMEEISDMTVKQIVHDLVIPPMSLEEMREYLKELEVDDYEPAKKVDTISRM